MTRIQKILTLVAFAFATLPAFAQMQIGYCNTDSIIVKMPEYQNAMTQLEALSATYQAELQEMESEISAKMQNAQVNRSTWTDLRLQREADEINTLQASLQNYAQEAQQDLRVKEIEYLTPVLEKLQEAVDYVGTEQGYDYVLDASVSRGVVIFKKDDHDISNDVLTHLGIL